MKIVIKGDDRKVKKLAKELKLKCKRKGLIMLIEDKKQEEAKTSPVKKEETLKEVDSSVNKAKRGRPKKSD